MSTRNQLLAQINQVTSSNFEEVALAVFRYQAAHNALYKRFLELLGCQVGQVAALQRIPCLPISFFKSHTVQTGQWAAQTTFESSGTTGQQASRHHVRDLDAYLRNTVQGFEPIYGHPREWLVLALLPSYLERGGSSLVAMANHFIQLSKYPQSGFFLHDLAHLRSILEQRPAGVPTLLLGVTYALLDFAEQFPGALPNVTIMETGGMKGRRREMTRQEVHQILRDAFGVPHVDSEYGMTELMSQGYMSGGESVFRPAPTLRLFTTEINDPLCPTLPDRTGLLNLVDLANLDSVSFICSEDIGKVKADYSFEVLGRLDTAEMRGCNLMVE
jgi:hypothetical protein